MSLTRRQEILRNCKQQVMKQLISKVKTEKQKFNKRNYAQGSKMKPADYFYLRMDTFMTDARLQMLRLGVGEEWIDEILARNFKVCRKNSRGHTGVKR